VLCPLPEYAGDRAPALFSCFVVLIAISMTASRASRNPGSLDSCSLLGVRDRFRRDDMKDVVDFMQSVT